MIMEVADMKKVVAADKAPAAIGPYSQAVQAGDFLFVSGQVPFDPQTGQLVAGSIEAQAERSLENVKAIVESAGFTMQQVVKATVFVTDMGNFAPVNGVYSRYFTENPPARSFVAVKELPRGAQVEIEVIVWKG
jgi:2-iminobutanoate/2-iminopropanoate deaminase